MGNGASIEDVIINGNTTDYGYKESFGIMVNYIYKLDKLEKIHEDYINHKKISYSDKIKNMSNLNRKISVAPMMDCTDRHDRYFS